MAKSRSTIIRAMLYYTAPLCSPEVHYFTECRPASSHFAYRRCLLGNWVEIRVDYLHYSVGRLIPKVSF